MQLVLVLAAVAASVPPQTLDEAEFNWTSSSRLPAMSDPGWEAVKLPDRWRQRRIEAAGPGWYRFQVRIDEAVGTDLWAVYLPDVNMNAAVFMNGSLVGVEGAMDGDLGNNWNRPLFFTFPSRILRPGPNELLVQIQSRAFAFGGLGPVSIGPVRALEDRYYWRRFFTVSIPQVVSCIAILFCLCAVGIWYGSRRQALFGWFAIATAWHVVAILNYHVRDLPVSRELWEWIESVAPTAFGISSLVFLHRLVGKARPRLERILLVAALIGAVLMALSPPRWFYEASNLEYFVGIAAAPAAVWTAVGARRVMSRFEARALFGSLVAGALFAIHDLVVQVGLLGQESIRLLPHAMSIFVLALGGVVVARFVRALEADKRHNVELRKAVRDREVELAEQFARVREFEKAHLLNEERQRLMREVHDGLGSHLASTLAMTEASSFCRDDVVASLRVMTEELSLLIDTLDPTLDDLASALAVWRDRIEPRVSRSGLAFQWQVGEIALVRKLTPDELHHLMRIMQEAVANILKHSRARTVKVRTSVEDGRLVLEIRDDGIGLMAKGRTGRGLSNMEARARQLRAELSVSSADPGTSLVLRFPFSMTDGPPLNPPA